jgi:hypothetical protein
MAARCIYDYIQMTQYILPVLMGAQTTVECTYKNENCACICHLLEGILKLLKSNPSDTYHMSNHIDSGWWSLACWFIQLPLSRGWASFSYPTPRHSLGVRDWSWNGLFQLQCLYPHFTTHFSAKWNIIKLGQSLMKSIPPNVVRWEI